jgi:hypothetical protein
MSEGGNSGRSTGLVILLSLLTILFITLKVCKIVNWSWVMVLTPLWVSSVLLTMVIVGGFIIAILRDSCRKSWKKS